MAPISEPQVLSDWLARQPICERIQPSPSQMSMVFSPATQQVADVVGLVAQPLRRRWSSPASAGRCRRACR